MAQASASAPFVQWCTSRGCDLGKVDLRDSPRDSKDFVNDAGEAIGSADDAARGRGVYAVVDIKAGERVLTVPYSACISQAGLGKGAGSLADAKLPFENATPAECVAWHLLVARGGDASTNQDTWKPYVDALPAAVDSPTSGLWDRKEVAELQIGEAVFKAALTLGKDAKNARTIAASGALPGGGDERDFAERWAWALSCVRSRAIELSSDGHSGATQAMLVPFVDMLNHKHVDPNVEWTTVAVANDESPDETTEDDKQKLVVALLARRDVSAGEELTISYATQSSLDEFCLYMGFLGGHNPFDSVELFKTTAHAAAWYAEAFKSESGDAVVDKNKAAAVASLFARRAGPGVELRLGWGGRVADVLVDMLVYFNKQIMPDDDPHTMAAHAVRVRCSELVAAFPTSAEEDLAWLEKQSRASDADAETRGRNERRKLAVEYRLRKKALLQHFIEA
jgi:histone-lysine N-methyltransferase SETD3